MTFIDTVVKMWAAGILITICSWGILYLAFKAVGGDQVSFIITLSLGVVVVLQFWLLETTLRNDFRWGKPQTQIYWKAFERALRKKADGHMCYLFIISLICCSMACPRQ